MSEDENKASETGRSGIEERNQGGPLPSAEIANPEIAPNSPLSISNIEYLSIVEPDHRFGYHLDADGSHQVSMYVHGAANGEPEWLRRYEWTEGFKWHYSKFTNTNRTGLVRLFHMWSYYDQNSGWHDFSCYISPIPQIDSQSVYTNAITGSGGDSTSVSVWVHNGSQISPEVTPANSRWSLPLYSSVHPGTYDITILQHVPGFKLRYSLGKTITYLANPKILVPANNAVVAVSPDFEVKGNYGAPDKVIELTNHNGSVSLGTDTANSDGGWAIDFDPKKSFPHGGWTVLKVRHIESGDEGWTQLRIFLLSTPTIDPIPEEVETNVRIEGGGRLDIDGHSVNIFADYSTIKIDSAWIYEGRWAANLVLKPGPRSITATQLWDSFESERAASHFFKVRPTQPTLNVEYVEDRTYLHGIGYNDTGFKVEVHRTTGGHFLSADVVSGIWREQIPDTVVPRTYTLTCRQSVSDGNGGFIYSTGWVQEITVKLPTPQPTVLTPIVNGQRVTFLGAGHQWGAATVQVRLWQNGSEMARVPVANVSPTREWQTTSGELPPGIYDDLRATQWVNSQHSAPVDVPYVVINSPPPGLNPIEDNGFSPRFSGTCWPDATLHLEFSGDDQTYPVTDTDKDGRWEYTHVFSPGGHTVTVRQTFGGQTSGPVTRRFDIGLPPPVITWPAKDEKVDYRVAVQGRGGHVGSMMKIVDWVTKKTLGEALVGKSAEWTVRLEELERFRYTIYAQATFGTVSSEPSPNVAFEVELMPPHINLEPIDSVARTFRIGGIARPSTDNHWTEIELWLNGQPLPRFRVKRDGTWWYQGTLPLGHYTLQAKQFHAEWESEFGQEHKVAVVPDSPVMETPALDEPVGQRVAIAGFGYVGDSIAVALADALDVVLGSTDVQENGTWWLRVTLNEPAGGHSLVARQSCGEFISAWSAQRPFVLRTEPPTFTRPKQGDWVPPMAPLEGSGKPDAAVHLSAWYNPDYKIATDVSVTDGQWATSPFAPLHDGPWWVSGCQTVAGVLSDAADSDRFEVLLSDDRTDGKSS